MFAETFTSLSHITPKVLYPIPNFSALNPENYEEEMENTELSIPKSKVVFLSINRYERKKNLGLAIRALGKYQVLLVK